MVMSGFNSKKQMAESRWIVELEADGEDLILPFTDEMIEQTGWQVGDTLVWDKKDNSSWTLRKKP
jgi:hypothetical protein